MDLLTIWILVCVINAAISFWFNSYLLNRGEDVPYAIVFMEVVLTLASFIGLLFGIIMLTIIFLAEHGDEPAIKSKHHENKNKFNQS